MQKLSVAIITYNEEDRIRKTLESVKWCDEIIVLDSGSTDKTTNICGEYANCKVFHQKFSGYGPQKQSAVDKTSNDWVLSIDADEVLTDAFRKEITALLSATEIREAGFYVPITLVFMGKVFRRGSESKFMHLRLFNKTKGGFDTLGLHEGVKLQGNTRRMKSELLHYSYRNLHHYMQKLNDYTSLYAESAYKKGKKTGGFTITLRYAFEFFRQYFIRGNFWNGYPGFVWSVLSALYVFVKMNKLYEKR